MFRGLGLQVVALVMLSLLDPGTLSNLPGLNDWWNTTSRTRIVRPDNHLAAPARPGT